MKITIIGPGAIGMLLYAHLARSKEEIWLLDKRPDRVEKLRKSGIVVGGLSKISCRVNIAQQAKEIGPSDLVVICVKSLHTEEALKKAGDLMTDNTFVLTLQNGLGNVQILKDIVGEEKAIAGVTEQAALAIDIGRLQHTGKGETIIGRLDKSPLGKARNVLTIFNQSGFPTRSTKDINSFIWSKLIINTGINALTAIAQLKNGALLEHPEIREVMRQAVSEAVRVAKKKRIKLTYDDPIQKVESICKTTKENISSMLQDILNKRPTEIDFINGAIVRQGKSLGLATPVNETLTNLIKTIEQVCYKIG